MADNNEQDRDVVEGDEQIEQQEGETPESDEDQHESEAGEGDADSENVITIDGEAPPHDEDEVEGKPAPDWVKKLRVSDREKAKKIRELTQQLAEKSVPQQAVPVLGTKPTLESVDYDTDRFEAELTEWHERKRKADDVAAAAKREVEERQSEVNSQVSAYKAASKSIGVAQADFEESEAVVTEHFSPMQQQIMLDAVSTPKAQAELVSALGRNESRLKQLASIKNPIKFAVALADLEKKLTVTPRKAPPAPERVVRGSATAVGVNDPKLARLEAAADKSGDRSELVAYKKHLKAKANA